MVEASKCSRKVIWQDAARLVVPILFATFDGAHRSPQNRVPACPALKIRLMIGLRSPDGQDA